MPKCEDDPIERELRAPYDHNVFYAVVSYSKSENELVKEYDCECADLRKAIAIYELDDGFDAYALYRYEAGEDVSRLTQGQLERRYSDLVAQLDVNGKECLAFRRVR